MSNAFSGVGTKFYRWNDAASADNWVAIAEILSIKGPGKKRETIEVTNLDSADGYKEFIAGFKESGQISLSMNFTPDGYDVLDSDFEKDAHGNYQIVLGNEAHTSFEFDGNVIELSLSVGAKDAVTADATIQITGKIIKHVGMDSGSPS